MVSTFNYSKEEVEFFKLLLQNDVRPDGRQRHQSKYFKLTESILPSCEFSLEIKNLETNIYFSLKADVSKTYEPIDISCDSISYNSVFSSGNKQVKGGRSTKDQSQPLLSEVQEVLYLLDKLILSKVDKKDLKIDNYAAKNVNKNNEMVVDSKISNDENDSTMYWKLCINIFSLEKIYLHNLQTIAFGVNYLLNNVKLPQLRLFKNTFTEKYEYEVIKGCHQSLFLNLGNLLVIGSFNGNLFLDPALEELCILEALVFVVLKDKKIRHFETYGFLVDLANLESLEEFIKQVEYEDNLVSRVEIIKPEDEEEWNFIKTNPQIKRITDFIEGQYNEQEDQDVVLVESVETEELRQIYSKNTNIYC